MDNTAVDFLQKGAILQLKHQFAEAILMFEKAIANDPTLELGYLNLGSAQRELGQYEAAEQNLRKALEFNALNFESHFALGYTLVLAGRIQEGIFETAESIRLNPQFLPGYLALGTLYTQAGRTDVANALYKEGLRLNPGASILERRLRATAVS